MKQEYTKPVLRKLATAQTAAKTLTAAEGYTAGGYTGPAADFGITS